MEIRGKVALKTNKDDMTKFAVIAYYSGKNVLGRKTFKTYDEALKANHEYQDQHADELIYTLTLVSRVSN